MKELINEDGSVNVHKEFTFPGSKKKLKIIGTFDIYKSNIWNLIEEVKNLETNKIVEVSREKLRQLKPIIII
jgi:hypothetical protein|tara:strand:- start:77 stop:292 length:216 start_codon:yes stop_codon:yes gene_type:complete